MAKAKQNSATSLVQTDDDASQPVFREAIASIVAEIRKEHEQFMKASNLGLYHSVQCGRHLRRLRRFAEGRWEEFFEKEVAKPLGISLRTAQRYMKNAIRWDEFLKNNSDITNDTAIDSQLLDRFRHQATPRKSRPAAQDVAWSFPEDFLSVAKSVLGDFDTVAQGLAEGTEVELRGRCYIALDAFTDSRDIITKAISSFFAEKIGDAILVVRADHFLASDLIQFPVAFLNSPIELTKQSDAGPIRKSMGTFFVMCYLSLQEPSKFSSAANDIGVVFLPAQNKTPRQFGDPVELPAVLAINATESNDSVANPST